MLCITLALKATGFVGVFSDDGLKSAVETRSSGRLESLEVVITKVCNRTSQVLLEQTGLPIDRYLVVVLQKVDYLYPGSAV
jgi:hypothetical protein